ncbi:MAG TPA: ABC transporter permease, partial [Longimicrobiales bacterium]|nr:ABC transporter permease [Longimicrobiales bacterium]
MPDLRRLAPMGVAAGALVATGLVAWLGLRVGGYDALAAAGTLVDGAFGSPDAVLSVTLVRAVPLILAGLAVALAFRAGIWNIGAEGQLYAGAIAAAWVGLSAGGLPGWTLAPLTLAAAAGAGLLWALVPALMRIRLGVDEVITTILMNFVAIHLAGYVVRGPLQEARGVFPQTDPIAEAARLPALVPGTRLHVGILI